MCRRCPPPHQVAPLGPPLIPLTAGGKTDITKVGLNSIENDTIKQNLMGKSRFMGKKGWVDSQGRKGKVRLLTVGCSGRGALHSAGRCTTACEMMCLITCQALCP